MEEFNDSSGTPTIMQALYKLVPQYVSWTNSDEVLCALDIMIWIGYNKPTFEDLKSDNRRCECVVKVLHDLPIEKMVEYVSIDVLVQLYEKIQETQQVISNVSVHEIIRQKHDILSAILREKQSA